MAPKPKKAPDKAAEKVKTEDGLTGKSLDNKIQYKKRTMPDWLKDYYHHNIRYGHGLSKEEKQEFLEKLLRDRKL